MKIEELNISRRPSYDNDYPNMLVGTVKMRGGHGSLEVKLSTSAVSQIFALIQSDVKRVAKYNAEQSDHAVEEVIGEGKLLQHIDGEVVDEATPF